MGVGSMGPGKQGKAIEEHSGSEMPCLTWCAPESSELTKGILLLPDWLLFPILDSSKYMKLYKRNNNKIRCLNNWEWKIKKTLKYCDKHKYYNTSTTLTEEDLYPEDEERLPAHPVALVC